MASGCGAKAYKRHVQFCYRSHRRGSTPQSRQHRPRRRQHHLPWSQTTSMETSAFRHHLRKLQLQLPKRKEGQPSKHTDFVPDTPRPSLRSTECSSSSSTSKHSIDKFDSDGSASICGSVPSDDERCGSAKRNYWRASVLETRRVPSPKGLRVRCPNVPGCVTRRVGAQSGGGFYRDSQLFMTLLPWINERANVLLIWRW